MAQSDYRVFISIPEGDVEAIRVAFPAFYPPERHGILTEVLADGRDGMSELVIDVAAGDTDAALYEAARLYLKAREVAGLEHAEPAILGFNVPTEVGETLHDRLFATAEIRNGAGFHSEAVVIAQTACEVLAREALLGMAQAAELEWVKDVLPRVLTLRERVGQKVFEGLTGKAIQNEPWWEQYVEHVLRRHAVVHDGATVGEQDAKESLAAVNAFREFINAELSRGLPSS